MTDSDRTVIWCAVSSEEQADPNLPSLDEQEATGRRHCAQAGDAVVAVLRAEGFSRFESRLDKMIAVCPPYRELVDILERGEASKVVCAYYHRLWRTSALQGALCALADDLGVWLYSCAEPVQRGAEQTAMWMHAISGLRAEQEIRDLVERRRMGIRAQTLAGIPTATGQRPFGYLLVGNGRGRRLIPNEDERPAVEYIMQRRAQGAGYQTIIDELHDRGWLPKSGAQWTEWSIRYVCHNPLYAGYVRLIEWPGLRPKAPKRGTPAVHLERGMHEPLIGEELWQAVQRVNESHTRDYRQRNGTTRLFTGLVRCGLCGDAMTTRSYPSGNYGLECARYRRNGGPKSERYPDSCQKNTYSPHLLRRQVIEFLQAVLADPESWARAQERPDEAARRAGQIESLERQIAQIEGKRAALLDALELSLSVEDRAAVMVRLEQRSQAQAAARAQIVELRQVGERIRQTQDALYAWQAGAALLDRCPDEELRPILRQLIARIILIKGQEPQIILVGQQ